MPLSWNEIRHRAIAFSREWQGETREAAERHSFWSDFLNLFGVRRRTVATFEEPVKKLSGDWGYRPEPFRSDRHRIEYLFALYEQFTAPLVAAALPAREGRRRQTAP